MLTEDNAVNQQVASELLRDAGLVVDIAENGRIACDMAVQAWAADEPYHLILMDLQMPVMGGLEATRELRSQPHGAAVPVVAMTANAMASDRERCLVEGMVDFVAKPIEPDALFRALLRWITPLHADDAGLTALSRSDEEVPGTATDVVVPPIAGLDREAGLRRVRGKIERYTAMMRGFADARADSLIHNRKALAEQDRSITSRLAHTVKGLAGNIGATDLAQKSATVELAEGGSLDAVALAPMLSQLEDSLKAQVGAIRDALPIDTSVARDASRQVLNSTELAAVCKQLFFCWATMMEMKRACWQNTRIC